MIRNCSAGIVLWIVAVGAYAYVLRGEGMEMPAKAIVPVLIGTISWTALVFLTGSRHQWRDWRARNRLARGERPSDGDLVCAFGEIRAVFEPLLGPLSGEPCVAYSYDIGPDSRGQQTRARDYVGFGMTRCAVHTQYGQYLLGSFPVLEGFRRQRGDSARAAEYVASTEFVPLDGIQAIASMTMGLHREAPPLRKDWRLGEPSAGLENLQAVERLVEPGATVTAMGRYVAASNEIVSDLAEKGYLRLNAGGTRPRPEAVPWRALGSFLGGLLVFAAVNAALWFYLTDLRR